MKHSHSFLIYYMKHLILPVFAKCLRTLKVMFSSSEKLIELTRFSIEFRLEKQKALMMFKSMNGLAPKYLQNLFFSASLSL